MTSRRKRRSKSGKTKKTNTANKETGLDTVAVTESGHKSQGRSKKIRKSRTSKEYQKTEREVQALLALTSNNDGAEDGLSESVAFFCETSSIIKQSKHKINHAITEDAEAVTTDESAEDDEQDVDSNTTVTADAAPDMHTTHAQQHMQSGLLQHPSEMYIQIEDITEQLESLGTAQMFTCQRQKVAHTFNDVDLLYKPNKQLSLPLTKLIGDSSEGLLPAYIRAMLQRLHTEAQAQNAKLSSETVETLLQNPDFQSNERNGLYRTHCNSEAHEFQPIFCACATDAVEIPSRKLLKLCLRELRFEEHPALSEEHRLANRLDDMYDEYAELEQRKQCARLENRLTTERRVLQQLMENASVEQVDSGTTVSRLAQQARLVRELRDRLYDEEIKSRDLLQQMLQTWQQLKEVRQRQQKQFTRVQLRLQVNSESKLKDAAAQRRWTDRFERDLGELYREQLEAYYQEKRMWRHDRESHEKPQRPDLKRLARELKAQLLRCMGAPGEPQLHVMRIKDETYYTMPPAMVEAALQRKSFFMKIYCDSEFVGVTRTYRLEPDFRLHINEAIGIVLQRRLPKQLRIALYEKDKLAAPKKVANILMPLSAPTVAGEIKPPMLKISFRSHKQLTIAGRLSLHYECVEEAGDNTSMFSLAAETTDNNKMDNSELTLWHNRGATERTMTLPVALDDETCTFEETLLQFDKTSEMDRNVRFHLLRLRHLQRNEQTVPLRFIPALTYELPEDLCEIGADGGGQLIRAQNEIALIEPGNWMDPIDVHKHEGKKHLRALYEALHCQCARLHKMLEHTEQLLIGDEPASWGSFFRTLGLIFHPHRPLTPNRTDAKLLGAGGSGVGGAALNLNSKHTFRLVLMVVRATGIPVRDYRNVVVGGRDETLQKSQQASIYNSGSSSTFMAAPKLKYSNVRPFIVLSYNDKYCRSTTAEGSEPTWNEQLVLSLSGTLSELKDDVKITLYDELVEQQLHDDQLGVRHMDFYQRVHTNWLGEYRVPMGSLLAVPKLDGVIELHMPKVLLGYQRPVLDESLSVQEATIINIAEQQQVYPEIRDSVHLWCYLSCEPGATLQPLRVNCLECIESTEVHQLLLEWSTMVQELQPMRYQPPLICTPDGKRVCLTRLLQPIALPIDVSENLLESACRFVSLLSVLRQPNASAGWQGVWLNNRWMLDTSWCSAKDLGVLLCNFLLTIGLQCWLVLGIASPYGECTYVLYRSEAETSHETTLDNMWLIEPCTGKRYAPRDVFCPLSRVNYIVSQENIYCNIQREMRVSLTNFNLNDSACWLPAFSKRIAAPSGGVQHLNYAYKSANNTHELRRHIERKIMKKITAWRTMRKTIWNRAFQPRLMSILEQLEYAVTFNRNNGRTHSTNYAKQLATEFPSFRFYGFTLNFAYTNLAAISERIKSTGLHLRSEPLVEFSVAVHIQAYPQNVLSIWIFLLASVPNS